MTHSRHVSIWLLAASALILPMAAQAQSVAEKKAEDRDPGAWRLTTGINYSSGDYGETQDTDVISVPVGIKYSRGGFNVRVSVPYVRVSGPGSLIDTPQGRDFGDAGDDSFGRDNSGSDNSGSGSSGSGNSGSGSSNSGSGSSGSGSSGSGSSGSNSGSGIDDDDLNNDGLVDVTGSPARNTRSGLGDVSVSMGYSFDFGNDFYADVTGRVKLPTASRAKRMGTGKVDVTLGLDLAKDIGNVSVYAGGRRKFTGKPVGSTLRNVWGIGTGLSIKTSKTVSLGLDYDWQQGSSLGNGASSEITGWASFRLSPTVRMQAFASTGLNQNSADLAGGLGLSWRFQ